MYDTYNFILRMIALLTSLYLGDVLSLLFNSPGKIALQSINPFEWLLWYFVAAVGLTGSCGSCFVLEATMCFLLLLFLDYPVMCCTAMAFFSFFFRSLVSISWCVGSKDFVPHLLTVQFLPLYGFLILFFLVLMKRAKKQDSRQTAQSWQKHSS